MKEFWTSLKAAWLVLAGAVAFVGGIAGLLQWLKPDALQVLTGLVGFQILITVFLAWVLIHVMDRGFGELKRAIKGEQSAGPLGNPGHSTSSSQREKNEEKKPKPTGAGAFAGMVAGGALGLPFGPPGVLIGGILGALIGNQVEYDTLKKRKHS